MNAPEGGLYRPLVLCLALLFVAAGALLTIQMISTIVGPFRIADVGVRDPRTVVALWRPLDALGGATLRTPFGHELVASGRAAREVTALGGLDPGKVGVLVLSEPRALTAGDLAALEAYLEAGGGVVLLGSVAVRNPDGSWRGYELMQRLLGARIVEVDASASAFTTQRRGPISAALTPREQVPVAFEPGTPGVLAEDAELRWIGRESAAAAIRRTRGKGRLAWIAVRPERAIPGEHERRRARRVVEAAVAWASRTPSVEILPWPGAAAFASVVSGSDTETERSAIASWRAEIDGARRDAGIAELRVPREQRAREALEPALAETLAALRGAAWIASRQELSQWTRSRAVVEASLRRAGPRRIAVEVTNRGAEIEGLVLRVHVNEPLIDVRVQSTKLMQAEATARLLPDGEAVDLALPLLGARSSAAYSLDIEPTPLQVAWGDDG